VARWSGFERQAPELAGAVRRQLTATRHCVLGTLRADGSPRLTGLESQFGDGELWLAMMPDSRKADDLRRDPRFALHSAPDVSMADGDAKVNGIAVLVDDAATRDRFAATLPHAPPSSGFALFRAELTDASLARVDDDHMVIDSWRDGEAPRQVRRSSEPQESAGSGPVGALSHYPDAPFRGRTMGWRVGGGDPGSAALCCGSSPLWWRCSSRTSTGAS